VDNFYGRKSVHLGVNENYDQVLATRGEAKQSTANQSRKRVTKFLQVNWINAKKSATDQGSYFEAEVLC